MQFFLPHTLLHNSILTQSQYLTFTSLHLTPKRTTKPKNKTVTFCNTSVCIFMISVLILIVIPT